MITKVWYSVDENGMAFISFEKPCRDSRQWTCDGDFTEIKDKTGFPAITWDDEPVELELSLPAESEKETPRGALADVETKVAGPAIFWYAVDKYGKGTIHVEKPNRFVDWGTWHSRKGSIPDDGFSNLPALTWDDEPVKIELLTANADSGYLSQVWDREIPSIVRTAYSFHAYKAIQRLAKQPLTEGEAVGLLKDLAFSLEKTIHRKLLGAPEEEK